MDNEKKYKSTKKLYVASVLSVILAALAFIAVTLSWFYNKREIDSLTWIKTPIRLDIGSGNNHSITYLDMGAIDTESEIPYKDYVFCVYGEPVDIYSLQLAYTTNIAFSYDVYRAELGGAGTSVTFTYTENGVEYVENFSYDTNKKVISGKPLSELTEAEISVHQNHELSYGDDNGLNPTAKSKVQSNAEPLYWLASENGVSVMNPVNKIVKETGESYFCDYYVIHISWEKGTVINDKETDLVYLTASR